MRQAFLRGSVAALYTAGLVLANAAVADLAALREGDMRKLVVHAAPVALGEAAFTREDGSEGRLGDYAGEIAVVNFWATWCAPCREEMPTLEALAGQMAGRDVAVVTIATGRNSPEGMAAFFGEIGVEALPLHTDPRQALAREMGILGLPVTVILDREGREVARLQGEADWSAPEAVAVIEALLAE